MYAFTHKFHVHIIQEHIVDTEAVYVCTRVHQRDIATAGVPLPMSLPLSAPLGIADMLPSPLVVHTEGPL